MEKLTQYRSIARFVKRAIDLSLTKRAIDFSMKTRAINLSMSTRVIGVYFLKKASLLLILKTNSTFSPFLNKTERFSVQKQPQKNDRISQRKSVRG